MKIVGAHLFPIRLPFAKPLASARGVVAERRGTLVRLVSESGEVGWGEASPYPGFGVGTVAGSRSALAKAAGELLGNTVVPGPELSASSENRTRSSPCARAALECAVQDLWARTHGRRMYQSLIADRAAEPAAIACSAMVTGDDLDALESSARCEAANGFHTFKLKVGALDLASDLARVARLRDVLGPGAAIRLDANQSYEPDFALAALEGFACYEIEYFEEPLAAQSLDAMAALRAKSPIPLAADESAVREADALRVIEAGAADVIVIKPSAAGGPSVSLRVARAARAAGLQVVVTSLLDSAVGVSAAHQVAIAIANEGELPACGLATGKLLARDVASVEMPVQGRLPAPAGNGLGIEVEESRVRSCTDGPVVDLSA